MPPSSYNRLLFFNFNATISLRVHCHSVLLRVVLFDSPITVNTHEVFIIGVIRLKFGNSFYRVLVWSRVAVYINWLYWINPVWVHCSQSYPYLAKFVHTFSMRFDKSFSVALNGKKNSKRYISSSAWLTPITKRVNDKQPQYRTHQHLYHEDMVASVRNTCRSKDCIAHQSRMNTSRNSGYALNEALHSHIQQIWWKWHQSSVKQSKI